MANPLEPLSAAANIAQAELASVGRTRLQCAVFNCSA